MKKIRKNNLLPEIDSVKTKLAAYSAVAACVLTTGFDANAQCGTASAGAPLPVDIDGDGTPDITLNVASFPGPYLLSSGTAMSTIATSVVPTSFSFIATVVPPGPGTSWNGCITTQTTGGGFTAIDPNATAMGTINVTGSYIYNSLMVNSQYYIVYGVSLAYATAGANQLVGLTAGGSDVCAAIAGAAPIAYLGTCYNFSSIYFATASVASYSVNLNPTGSVILDHPPCTTTMGNVYSGLYQQLSYLPFSTVVPGGPLGTIASGTVSLGASCAPGSTFLGVEFAGGDGTQYGWVEVTVNPDGSVTCVNTGYNGCSVEEVAAAGVGDECIAVGDPTVNTANEACSNLPPDCPDGSNIGDPCDDMDAMTSNDVVQADCTCAGSPDSTTDIPTLSEWGLITLMLLLMSYGSIAMSAVGRLAGVTTRNVPLPGNKMFSLPFNNSVYRKALLITGLLVAGGFAASIATIGTVLMSDIIGSMIAGPVFAYLAHLLYLLETNRKKN